MKKYLIIGIILALSMTLVGCGNKPDPDVKDDPVDPVVPGNPVDPVEPVEPEIIYTYQEFYDDFAMFEERLNTIIENTPEHTPNMYTGEEYILNPDEEFITITRDDAIALRNSTIYGRMNFHYNQLQYTKEFVDRLKLLIDNTDVELNEEFSDSENPGSIYTLYKTEEHSILLKETNQHMTRYLNLVMNEGVLEYQEYYYHIDLENRLPNEEISWDYSGSSFIEGQESISFSHYNRFDSFDVIYFNIDTLETVSFNYGLNESPTSGGRVPTYVINGYNPIEEYYYDIHVSDGELISDSYTVNDEHSTIYSYTDNFYNDVIYMDIEATTASGWDYATFPQDTNMQGTRGLYLNDGTTLYDGPLRSSIGSHSIYLALKLELNEFSELTNDVFSLSSYGLNLTHPKANLEYFNSIKMNSLDDAKEKISIPSIDIFSNELEKEFDLFVNDEITSNISEYLKANDEPINITGDVEDFNNALDQFQATVDNTGQYSISDIQTWNYIGNGMNDRKDYIRSFVTYDSNQLLYLHTNRDNPFNGGSDYKYFLDGTSGKLIEFTGSSILDYTFLNDQATLDNFNQSLNNHEVSDPLEFATNIKKVDDHNYEITLDTSYFNEQGISLKVLFNRIGILGMKDEEIIATVTFTDDYSSYKVSYVILGLNTEYNAVQYDFEILREVEYLSSIQYQIVSPLQSNQYKYYLPQTPDGGIQTFGMGHHFIALHNGFSYMNLSLDKGEYKIFTTSNYDIPITIYDKDMNQIPYDGERFNASYDGTYYAMFDIPSDDLRTEVYIEENPTPLVFDFTLNTTDGTLNGNIVMNQYNISTITVPSYTEERIVKILPHFRSESTEFGELTLIYDNTELNITTYCGFFKEPSDQRTCYYKVPANEAITIEIRGIYEGAIELEYSYIAMPEGVSDNTFTWTDIYSNHEIFLTNDSPLATIHFTITEAGYYELDFFRHDFTDTYPYPELRDSAGEVMIYHWMSQTYLEPGDYTIEILTDELPEIEVIIETRIKRIT